VLTRHSASAGVSLVAWLRPYRAMHAASRMEEERHASGRRDDMERLISRHFNGGTCQKCLEF
jgi:hypothetical protein